MKTRITLLAAACALTLAACGDKTANTADTAAPATPAATSEPAPEVAPLPTGTQFALCTLRMTF